MAVILTAVNIKHNTPKDYGNMVQRIRAKKKIKIWHIWNIFEVEMDAAYI